MTGKAALNYEIKDLKYVYFYVPGIGTAVISNDPFPGAVEQKHAFDDKTLTVTVGEHIVQLIFRQSLVRQDAGVRLCAGRQEFFVPTKFPVMGYGPIRVAPYAWPGSRKNGELKGSVEAPPLPARFGRPCFCNHALPARCERQGHRCCLGRPPLPVHVCPS